MNVRELEELHTTMDEYGYFEPDIYASKGELIMFIDQTRLDGNPVMFDPETQDFTVAVFDDEDVGDYEYESDEWEEGIPEMVVKAYEAVRLARDLAKNRRNGKN